jgi:4-alpha-glucanotransferase
VRGVRKLRLVIGTHNHLPIGQPDFQTENMYQRSLKPLLSVLYAFADLPVVLHYSGLLLEWLEEEHPEFLMLLAEMVKRRQVEILGGGYYDPILSLIPTNDKLGQLEKMTTHLRVRFETRPRGCWLAEKVWEPGLASVLRASGMDYTFLDDEQFRAAGMEGRDLLRPFIAEDQGKIITLFPVCTPLGDLLTAGKPAEAMAYLKEAAGAGDDAMAVLLLDGSRDLGQQGAARSSLAGGWFDTFLRLVSENTSWLDVGTTTRFLRDGAPTEKLYVPCSCSRRMASWLLPPRRRRALLDPEKPSADAAPAGGISAGLFRQFLSRYPEGELMYSKMMYAHVLVNQVRGDKYKKKSAQNELWKGQCNPAYWFGGSGGIYSNALRKAVYKALIESEKLTRATEIFAPSIIGVDFDLDNITEYLYQGSELNAYVHPRGGLLFELDFLPVSWNYLDTMARRDESGASRRREGVPTDRHQRKGFMDHFFPAECGVESFDNGRFEEAGDFLDRPYEVVDLNRTLPEITLRRAGSVLAAGLTHTVEIEKRYVFRPRSIDVYYRLANRGGSDFSARFGVEMNLSLASRTSESGRIFLLDEDRKTEIGSERRETEGVRGLLVRDVPNNVSITFSSARESVCWSLPVETVTPHPEEGQESTFQSYCFVPQWNVSLAPGEIWENQLSMGFERSKGS